MAHWKTESAKYGGPIFYLISGTIPVGKMSYNLARSKGDGPENRYAWMLLLPGNARKGYAADENIAKAALEAAFVEWCQKAKLGQLTP